ncbi:hypothetical protein GGF50DRAFT_42757 [Schizophyllum commune]
MTEYDFSQEGYERHMRKMHRVYNWTCDNARIPQKNPFAPPTPATGLMDLPYDAAGKTKSRQRSASMHDTRARTVIPPKRSSTTPTNPYGSKHSNSSYTLVQPVVTPPVAAGYPAPPPPQIIYYNPGQSQAQPRRHHRANSYAAPPPPQVYGYQAPVTTHVYPYPTTAPRKSTSSAQRPPIVVPQAVPQYTMPTSPKQQPLIKRLFGFGRKNSVRSSSREPSRDERRGSKESTTTTRSITGSGRAAIAPHLSTRARRPITITGHLVTASAGSATRHFAARDIPPDHPGTITRTSPLLHAATRATSPPPHEFPSPAAFISLSRPVPTRTSPYLDVLRLDSTACFAVDLGLIAFVQPFSSRPSSLALLTRLSPLAFRLLSPIRFSHPRSNYPPRIYSYLTLMIMTLHEFGYGPFLASFGFQDFARVRSIGFALC